MKIFARIVVFCLFAFPAAFSEAEAASKMIPWDTDIKPGDRVCIYDIAEHDPLVDYHNDSLKYNYRAPSGDQRWFRQLRPMVRKLVLVVAWPGLQVSATPDKIDQYWYSGWLFVIKGGHKPEKNLKKYEIKRGKNILLGQGGRSWVMPAHMLHFTHVRLKRKIGMFSCARKYESF
jgi:hypothetical protein